MTDNTIAELQATMESFHKTKFHIDYFQGRLTIRGKAKTKVRKATIDLIRAGFSFEGYHENPYAPGTISAVLVKA
jgi:HSP20 family molecular chaperone IbpA